ISQGNIGKHLSDVANMLSKEIDQNSFEIIYKLHPGEYDTWKDDYPWLLKSNIKVIDNSLHDMHYYFSFANIQIGVNSTALFEGIAYNLPTFILKTSGYEIMNDLIESGYMKLVKNHSDIKKILKIPDYK